MEYNIQLKCKGCQVGFNFKKPRAGAVAQQTNFKKPNHAFHNDITYINTKYGKNEMVEKVKFYK